MSRGLPRNPRREMAWRRWVSRQSSSGLSVRQYCRKHDLKESAFYFWRTELARRASRPAFVPVTVSAAERVPVVAGHLEIALAGGVCVRLAGTVDRQLLADVLAVLEERSC